MTSTVDRLPPPGPKTAGLAASLGSFVPFAADIKLAHSVFALPFAMSAFVLGRLPLPHLRQIALLLVCMVSARTFAMGMNRVLDRRIDLANPRTKGRMIPSGQLSARQGLAWSVLAGSLFVAAACGFGPLAAACAVPLLVLLALYSVMKHLTWLTHWYLGLCLGLAPVGVAVALTGQAPAAVLLVGLGVALWTGGFDVLYALQDRGFDRQHRLQSIPSRFGPAATLAISRVSFAAMIAALAGAGWLAGCGLLYYIGLGVIAALLIYEHVLVRDAKDSGVSRNLNMAFFNMNAYVSVLYFSFTALDAFFF